MIENIETIYSKVDKSLILNDIERDLSKLHKKVFDMYLLKYKITEIVKETRLTRFKINRMLKQCKEYLKTNVRREYE